MARGIKPAQFGDGFEFVRGGLQKSHGTLIADFAASRYRGALALPVESVSQRRYRNAQSACTFCNRKARIFTPKHLCACREFFLRSRLSAAGEASHHEGQNECQRGQDIRRPIVTVTISFDVHSHGHSPIELYGSEGSLKVPDPNTFGGPLEIWTPTTGEWRNQALSHPYSENSRSIGAADMAYAILDGSRKRSHRSSGALAYHVLEVMHAFEKSSGLKKHVSIASNPPQPKPLPLGLIKGRL